VERAWLLVVAPDRHADAVAALAETDKLIAGWGAKVEPAARAAVRRAAFAALLAAPGSLPAPPQSRGESNLQRRLSQARTDEERLEIHDEVASSAYSENRLAQWDRHRREALRYAELTGDRRDIAHQEALYARELVVLGDSRAAEYARRALKRLIPAEDFGEHIYARTLSHAAMALQVGGAAPDEVLKLSEAALAAYEAVPDLPKQEHWDAIGIIANSAARAGDLRRAAALWRRAITMAEEDAPCNRCPSMLVNLSGVEERLGNKDEALALRRRALAYALRSQDLWEEAYAFGAIARLYGEGGRLEAGIFHGKSALERLQGLRTRMTGLDPKLRGGFLQSRSPYYRAIAGWLVDAGSLAEAEQVLHMLKESELNEFLRGEAPASTAGAFRYVGPQAEAKSLLEQLRARARALSIAEIVGALERIDAILVAAGIASATKATPELEALRRSLLDLGDGVVMLHYIVTPDRLLIILSTPRMQVAREVKVPQASLEREIFSLRRALQDRSPQFMPAARRMYDIAVRPMAADLERAGARTVMLSLDGNLRYVPFAALHDGERYLAARYASVVLTAAAREKLREPPQAQWRMAGLGVTRAHGTFPALPAVKRELESIRGRVLPGEIYLDEAFTAKRLGDTLAARYPLVHIASHFKFTPGTEADSFLLLGDGSRLTLKEMRKGGLDFRGVDLVTLSACETAVGGGRDEAGREIEGFAAVLQNQGAKGVLATLWPVADDSTARFMWTFYTARGARGVLTKAEALRRAQADFIVLTGADAALAHPFHWAPFVLLGHWL